MTDSADIKNHHDESGAFERELDAARDRMRKAATARVPTISARDIHTVLAALASTQAALRDLKEKHGV